MEELSLLIYERIAKRMGVGFHAAEKAIKKKVKVFQWGIGANWFVNRYLREPVTAQTRDISYWFVRKNTWLEQTRKEVNDKATIP